LIAGALFRAICLAFNVSYEPEVITPPQPPVVPCDCEALKTQITTLTNDLNQAKLDFEAELALQQKTANEKQLAYKEKIINFINSL
jgi:ribosomal protein S15P/S13E